MNKDFEVIEHTADIGIRAYGVDISRAFVNAARGMFSLITDIDQVNEVLYRDVQATAPDKEALLVEWLNELIFLFDTELVLFTRFHIQTLSDREIKSRCWGEKIDKSRHELRRGIKSATYHMLKVEQKTDYLCQVQVLFDI
jgi:SHS2 domain-containing protein